VPVFKALLYTGCRLNEIFSLRWSDVDLKRKTITVVQQKTRRQKVLPIAAELQEVFQALPRGIGDAYVFTRADGQPFATIEVQRAFGIARKLSAIRRCEDDWRSCLG
jgi:integrase